MENWRPRVGWDMGAIKSAPPETAHRGSWGRNTAIDRSMSAWDFFTWNTKRKIYINVPYILSRSGH